MVLFLEDEALFASLDRHRSLRIGKRVGLELCEPSGKNDDSVNGTHYVTCKIDYGVLIQQSQIRGVHGLELDASPRTCRSLHIHKSSDCGTSSATTSASRASPPNGTAPRISSALNLPPRQASPPSRAASPMGRTCQFTRTSTTASQCSWTALCISQIWDAKDDME
ncbi:cytoskeleton-associated protein [Laccaria bicolor S238N-H82]|uniref:Cytoskeleton-associated protein n=1 Tax=Laccaria bicolor (strain S238N-H82 / ATCC MYA-4686) TaxID=486041 RepID=B0CNT6_LACBS|nr:cytoskeleton-associated protein [Laccaria bicolor S238N-H82]EDR15996.1 cytoskeleton-associated protein [Laccaria bicolor S238N-H82]|eukprot:XP_001874204.1 cytoskeleton-associated protein [Laccaria bicolor S238N-H82]